MQLKDEICQMKIIPLSEGSFTIDKTKLFVPFEPGADQLHHRSTGSLLVEIQPFVVITSDDILLLDTGLGFETDGKLQLHSNLMNAGINPSEVTKVLLSHLHKDHAGGVSAGKDKMQLAFPQATYYLQKNELSAAFEKGLPSYVTDELECLKNSKQVELLDGNGSIADYISYEVTGAHSPWHQVFTIKADGNTVFFGGDDAPQLHQMKHRYVAKYDHDGRKAMGLRHQWWTEGQEKKWTFLFYHDIKTPIMDFGSSLPHRTHRSQ
jgi:glyoxylase-like metal-dependent hydrolase (beta-lactamase superfamily II)